MSVSRRQQRQVRAKYIQALFTACGQQINTHLRSDSIGAIGAAIRRSLQRLRHWVRDSCCCKRRLPRSGSESAQCLDRRTWPTRTPNLQTHVRSLAEIPKQFRDPRDDTTQSRDSCLPISVSRSHARRDRHDMLVMTLEVVDTFFTSRQPPSFSQTSLLLQETA